MASRSTPSKGAPRESIPGRDHPWREAGRPGRVRRPDRVAGCLQQRHVEPGPGHRRTGGIGRAGDLGGTGGRHRRRRHRTAAGRGPRLRQARRGHEPHLLARRVQGSQRQSDGLGDRARAGPRGATRPDPRAARRAVRQHHPRGQGRQVQRRLGVVHRHGRATGLRRLRRLLQRRHPVGHPRPGRPSTRRTPAGSRSRSARARTRRPTSFPRRTRPASRRASRRSSCSSSTPRATSPTRSCSDAPMRSRPTPP